MRASLALIMLILPGTALAQSAEQAPGLAAEQAQGLTVEYAAGVALHLAPPIAIDAAALPGLESLTPSIATAQAQALFGADDPVADGELAKTSGREQINWLEAVASNTSTVTNNSVGANSATGEVRITDSAFQNVSGISIMNFNTGNNSSINAGMSVNVQINYAQPTP